MHYKCVRCCFCVRRVIRNLIWFFPVTLAQQQQRKEQHQTTSIFCMQGVIAVVVAGVGHVTPFACFLFVVVGFWQIARAHLVAAVRSLLRLSVFLISVHISDLRISFYCNFFVLLSIFYLFLFFRSFKCLAA